MSKFFEIKIQQTLVKSVIIKAESNEEAMEKVNEMFTDNQIILTEEDCADTDIYYGEEYKDIEDIDIDDDYLIIE